MPYAFEAIYDLVDNFTGKYLAINDLVSKHENKNIAIKVDVAGFNQATSGAQGYGRALDDSTKRALEFGQVAVMTKKEIADIFPTGSQKVQKFFAEINTGINATVQGFNEVKYAIAGALVGGAIGGISYLDEKSKQERERALYLRFEKRHVNTDAIKKFVADATETGYTSGSQRVAALEFLSTRTKIRSPEKLQDIVHGAEKLLFTEQGGAAREQFGNAAGLIAAASRSSLRTDSAQAIADALSAGGKQVTAKKLQSMSVNARLRFINSRGSEITDLQNEKFMEEHPEIRMQINLDSFKDNIATALIGPMSKVVGVVANFIGFINKIPGGGTIMALGLALMTVLMALTAVATMLPSVAIGLATVSKVFGFASLSAKLFAFANVQVGASSAAEAAGVVAAGTASTVASTGFWAAASGLWAMVAPVLLIVVPLLALGAALYLIEKKTHMFSNAFKTLGKTQMANDLIDWFKSIGEWIENGIKWLDKLYKTGGAGALLKILFAAAIAGPFLLIGKILTEIGEFLQKLIFGNNVIADILEFASGLWKKVVDIAGDLWDGTQKFFGWIKDALGITRNQKEKRYEELSEKTGWEYKENQGAGKNGWYYNKVDARGNVTSYKEGMSLGADAHILKPPEKIVKAWEKFQGAEKGIIEKLFDKVGMSALINKITELINKLDEFKNGIKTGLENFVEDITPEPVKEVVEGVREKYNSLPEWAKTGIDYGSEFFKGAMNPLGFFAEGASFANDGQFTGIVHAPEEIIPQATAMRGPGPISNAIKRLGDTSLYTSKSASSKTTFTNLTVPVRIDRVSSDIDMRKMTGQIENVVKRALAQQRT